MIECYLLFGFLFASYEFLCDLGFDRTSIIKREFLKYISIIVLWPGYAVYLLRKKGIITKLKTDYLPKLKSCIDRKRGKEAVSE